MKHRYLIVILILCTALPASLQASKTNTLRYTSVFDGFPLSYYCGSFYNTNAYNGLPVNTVISVLSPLDDIHNVKWVGYYDQNSNPVVFPASGTVDDNKNADIVMYTDENALGYPWSGTLY